MVPSSFLHVAPVFLALVPAIHATSSTLVGSVTPLASFAPFAVGESRYVWVYCLFSEESYVTNIAIGCVPAPAVYGAAALTRALSFPHISPHLNATARSVLPAGPDT